MGEFDRKAPYKWKKYQGATKVIGIIAWTIMCCAISIPLLILLDSHFSILIVVAVLFVALIVFMVLSCIFLSDECLNPGLTFIYTIFILPIRKCHNRRRLSQIRRNEKTRLKLNNQDPYTEENEFIDDFDFEKQANKGLDDGTQSEGEFTGVPEEELLF